MASTAIPRILPRDVLYHQSTFGLSGIKPNRVQTKTLWHRDGTRHSAITEVANYYGGEVDPSNGGSNGGFEPFGSGQCSVDLELWP